MPGLVPGIHVLMGGDKDVDGRVKPGHDGKGDSMLLQSLLNTIDAIQPVISAITAVTRP
jgi:hypothetical protein